MKKRLSQLEATHLFIVNQGQAHTLAPAVLQRMHKRGLLYAAPNAGWRVTPEGHAAFRTWSGGTPL